MPTLIDRIKSRAWVGHIDDDRDSGSGDIVTLAPGYDFACDQGCGVRGCDTLTEAEKETRRSNVINSTVK
ncbi:TPA: hypothetical protein ACK3Q6_007013 [Burkholderia cepacia]|jgi:hypothetical protein|uniref:Uncharacterized protein n=5 Tax=Burkholderia cepacia complex TaxID=87882 RepID=A0A286P6L9_9BURK|nr:MULTISPECIES: hypothetical protein [Burkholderia]HDR9760272.1 hypothetical protein [Burkholderia cepacia ATCC 25416]KKL36373.1 hypothetical protein WR31_24525 [Burkholderia contaminans LMG 23361]MBA9830940.1 hypothetical protein [Burkholderia contaminans]MBA9839002.1 hypothetical protein [Burkholderia contaminans]MBA9864311.1 hypothetical protein [Burkholderia contaminans]